MLVSLVVMFWLPGGRAEQYQYKSDDEEVAEETDIAYEVSLIS